MWKKIKLIGVLAFVAVFFVVCSRWWATRVTPQDVLSFPANELRVVKVCRNGECATLGADLWPELLQRVGKLQSTLSIGWKGEESSDLYYLSFDWGERGTFQVRLWTRPSISERVIGTFEKHSPPNRNRVSSDSMGSHLYKSQEIATVIPNMIRKRIVTPFSE